MVIITFANGKDWFKANWVFRQLAQDVLTRFPHKDDVNSALERAEWFIHLALENLDAGIADNVIEALHVVAEETVQDKIAGWVGADGNDAAGHQTYIESM